MTTALKEIEKLVANTAKQALREDTSLQQKIDAIKSMAPYYALLSKAARADLPDDDGSFARLAAQITDAENEHGELFKLEPANETEPEQSAADKTGFELLRLGLKALSQRAIVAAGALFTLLTIASAFWLWLSVLPNPSILQLIGLGMYAVFVLAGNLIVRRT